MILRVAATFWFFHHVSSFTSTHLHINTPRFNRFAPNFGSALNDYLNGNEVQELNGNGAAKNDTNIENAMIEAAAEKDSGEEEEEVDEMQLFDEANMRLAVQMAQSTYVKYVVRFYHLFLFSP